MQIKSHNAVSLYTHGNNKNEKCPSAYGDLECLVRAGGNCEMVQLLWKIEIWQFLKKVPDELEIVLLGIYPE
jgi:hypothetical protein